MADAGKDGVYPAMYYNHNLDFLVSAAMMTGQLSEATKAATELVTNVHAMMADMAMIEPFGAKTMYVLLRFGKWQDVLALPAPDAKATILTVLSHFGRTVAHAKLEAVADAERERAAYETAKRAIPPDTPWLYNTPAGMFAVMDAVLDARLAAARKNTEGALAAWRKAVAAEDALNYDEPPDWYYPTRESLGAALLQAGRLDDAERTFREDLEHNPGNARSLFGLWQTLRASDPRGAATLVAERRFDNAWRDSEVTLTLADY
jgi:tetratricopeptide (TPR) repeat protein